MNLFRAPLSAVFSPVPRLTDRGYLQQALLPDNTTVEYPIYYQRYLDSFGESSTMDTEKLSSSSESSSESDSFLETQHTPPHPRTPWFWIISTIFFSLLSVVLLFKTGLGKPCPTSQRAWRRSDLGIYTSPFRTKVL
jgi:hypothetical protein